MISTASLILVLLGLGSFIIFRLFSRKVRIKSGRDHRVRLERIRSASRLFRYCIGFSTVVGIYSVLAFLCGWPFFSQMPARMVAASGHVYTSPSDMPGIILALMLVKVGLGLAAAAAMYALFGLYGRGILFSARNVLYIRFLGYYLILNSIVDYQIQSNLNDLAWSTTPVFIGLLIIFVAWIMDEGRKIQEEQELTA